MIFQLSPGSGASYDPDVKFNIVILNVHKNIDYSSPVTVDFLIRFIVSMQQGIALFLPTQLEATRSEGHSCPHNAYIADSGLE